MKNQNASDRQFYSNLFGSLAEEMGVTLARTAYSPNIKERRDFSCALYDGEGRMIAQAAHIPDHLGAMPLSVDAVRKKFKRYKSGDVFIVNDPFQGGTHLPDITLVRPVLLKSRVVAFLANRAHHADVGGITPGSLPLSTSIDEEGLRIPPSRLCTAGKLSPTMMNRIRTNTRTPKEREGDLRAQLAACEQGAGRLNEVLVKYGIDKVRTQMKDLLSYGRELMEVILSRMPKGRFRFEDVLDSDGIDPDPIKIAVEIRLDRKRAVVDFTGSAPECRGSLNAVEAITRSAVYYCFLCLLATPSKLNQGVIGLPSANSGCFDPIQVIAPSGTIVNARPPRAVAGGNVETSQRIVDVVLGALAKALPDLIPAASQGTMNNLTLGGNWPDRPDNFAYYETLAGGMGGRPGKPGLSGIQTHMTNTMNTPVEALEFAYPLRIERYEIRKGSGGKGRYRGGDGIVKEVRVLGHAEGTLLTERRTHQPYGLKGGDPGKSGRNTLLREGKKTDLGSKANLNLQPNDIIRIETPGGGAYGG